MDLSKKTQISLIVNGTGRGSTVVAYGTSEEMSLIFNKVNNDICSGQARLISVDLDEYNKYKEDINELIKLIQS